MKNTEVVITELKELIQTKGYIYALCMIIFDDFHINLEKLQEVDYRSRISTKEASLLLGFLIQNKIDFSTPDDPLILSQLKEKTYSLLEELHHSFMSPFFDKLNLMVENENDKLDFRKEQKDFFGSGDMLAEPIFYSGTGVYDFQYLNFLEKKYKYDSDWLIKNKSFDIHQIPEIVSEIKSILQEKAKKVRLYDLRKRVPELTKELNLKHPEEDWEEHSKEMQPMMELHQYVELFFENSKIKAGASMDDIREDGWKSFYKGLIDLFVIKKSDFKGKENIEAFLDNFSIAAEDGGNKNFKGVGSFNLINAAPILKLDDEKYFVPIPFLLFEAVYESPFYWVTGDKKYEPIAGKNRGLVGEEISYEFLAKVFGKERTLKSVRITSKKGEDDTDIDILCVLGSKALCVQVKSKKLTLLSRAGNDEQLQKDFKGAIQDAYNQGLVCRNKILERGCKFIDEHDNEIKLSEDIDEVYIMGITTENYPSLTHQAHVMLNKKDNEPFPLFSTIFDLELLTHYLSDPYDFLYYIRQRTSLMDYFKADEEIVFLGYHLDQKLWKLPNSDHVALNNDFGQLIDRNYYPLKAGIEVSDEGDAIKNQWYNKDFEELCNQLKTLNQGKVTDIIFNLLDWSGEARDDLVRYIRKMKSRTQTDGKPHNFSMPPEDKEKSNRLGVTYMSANHDNVESLREKLLTLCQVRKYKSKGDVWIGLGSLLNSPNMIDVVAYNDHIWEYDKELEEISNALLSGKGQGRKINVRKKIGRNDKCYCGSGLKYKKCCGKNS